MNFFQRFKSGYRLGVEKARYGNGYIGLALASAARGPSPLARELIEVCMQKSGGIEKPRGNLERIGFNIGYYLTADMCHDDE